MKFFRKWHTPKERDALIALYHNPYNTVYEICDIAGCSYPTFRMACQKIHMSNSSTSKSVFVELGYITIPEPDRSMSQIEQQIISMLRDNPFVSNDAIAEQLGYSKPHIVHHIGQIFYKNGFANEVDSRGWVVRMRFYGHMGWFNHQQLLDDLAYEEALYNVTF